MMEQDTKQKSLRQWYVNYIDYFREEYEKLSADEKRCVGNNSNFLSPCQIEIFWIDNLDYQLIIQSRFDHRPDKEIIVNGPYVPHEFNSKTIKILKDERWMQSMSNSPLGYEQHDTLGKAVASEIYRLVETSKNCAFIPQGTPHQLMGWVCGDTWISIHAGNIGTLEYIQEVNKIIRDIKRARINQETKPISQQPAPLRDDTYDGFGAHLFPAIIIGPKHRRSIDELVHNGPYLHKTDDKVFDTKIADNQIIVNKDGFIFIENKKKENALRTLNLIMAFGVFYGFVLHAVREHELAVANYDKEKLLVTNMRWSLGTRRAHLMDEHFNPKQNISPKTEVKLDTIKEILLNTEKLLAYEKLSEDMRMFNDSLTHLKNSEFAQSFVISWSMIERHYSDLWHEFVSQKNTDNKRLKKLTRSNQWTIEHVLEILSLQNEVDKNSYDLLMKLKKKRNSYHHKGGQIVKEDADSSLKYVTNLLVSKIPPHIHLSKYLRISNMGRQDDP